MSEVAGGIETAGERAGDLLSQGEGRGHCIPARYRKVENVRVVRQAGRLFLRACRGAKHFVKLWFIKPTEVNHGRSESRADDQRGPGRHSH